MRSRPVGAILIAVIGAATLLLGACGRDGSGTSRALPITDQIGPALAAVDAALGAPQEYFEVNADTRMVNLFVASDSGRTATPYLFLDGELQPPAPPREVQGGFTFVRAEVDFDVERILDRVDEELPDSTIERFVILGTPDGTPRYEVLVRSSRGGMLAVALGPTGAVLEVETL